MMNAFHIHVCLLLTVLVASPPAHAQVDDRRGDGPANIVIRPRLSDKQQNVPGLVAWREVRRPGVALILSGGGARGLSSIGVLKSFERNNIPIDLIVGTSIGSIVGGLYASGYSPAALERIAQTTDWEDVLSYNDQSRRTDLFIDQKLAADRSVLVLRFDGFTPVIPESYSSGQRLTNFLNVLVLQSVYRPDPSFDALRVPFRAVTTDLISGTQFVFRRGDLAEALRAAVAVPLLFSTVKKDTMQLLDGGLISNMPVDVALAEGMECIIVVDVTSPLRPAAKVVAPWEIGEQIMGIMMQEPNKEALEKADIVIRPGIGEHLSSDFTDVDSLIAAGEAAADASIESILVRLRSSGPSPADRSWPNATFDLTEASLVQEDREGILLLEHSGGVTSSSLQTISDELYQTGNYADVSITVDTLSAVCHVRATRYPVLRSVRLEGVSVLSVDSLLEPFAGMLGQPVNAPASRQALEKIVSMYRDGGFSLAHIETTELNPSTGQATIVVDEGVIARMTIRGTAKTRDYVIWRELPFGPGDVFNVGAIEKGLANIYSTNLFDQASVTIEHQGPDQNEHVVVFNLRERYTDLIRIGFRMDNERSFQPWLNVRDENFLGAGAEIGFSLSGGERNQSVIAELKAHRIFDSYLTSRIRAYMMSKDVNTFASVPGLPDDRFERKRTGEIREIRRGGSVSIGTQLERLGDVTVEGRLERHQAYNIVNQPITNEEYQISSVRFATRVDTQDKNPFPTEGTNLTFSYETALIGTASSIGFTKLTFSYETYTTYGGRHTIHPRLMVGLGDDAIPTTEQFSLGGQESFFGLREDNARGRQILVGGLEYVYRLPFRIYFDTYVSIRYDIGAVWLRPEEIRLVDLQHGVGVELGFDTPVGPAQFGLGRSFSIRRELLEKPLALGPVLAYFSIGFRFN